MNEVRCRKWQTGGHYEEPILMTMVCVAALAACAAEPGFTSLFDGKTLEGDKMVMTY